MVKISFNHNKKQFIASNCLNLSQIEYEVTKFTGLTTSEFYLESNGKRLTLDTNIEEINNVYCTLRVPGGKGGFGSMLRAIGAQIEKTTNREACRDLSGRRLRDINEEKRLRAWLEKQGEREREAEERKKRKIEKLLSVPKHEFKDEAYEEARSSLPEKVNDAFEEGFKKELEAKQNAKLEAANSSNNAGLKRKGGTWDRSANAKKKKTALWIDDNISSTDDSDSDDSDDGRINETKSIDKK